MSKNIIVATPNIELGKGFKTHLERNGFNVLEVATYLEMVIESLVFFKEEGTNVDTIILSSDIAVKLNDKRLEVLANTIFTIRKEYNVKIVLYANEQKGHPFLAEIVQMGVYNIFIKRDNHEKINIKDLIKCINESKSFSEVADLLEIDHSIPWRKDNLANFHTIKIERDFSNTNTTNNNDPSKQPEQVQNLEKNENKKAIEKIIKKPPAPKVITEYQTIALEYQLIIVGSPFSNVGSTFFSMLLSRIISNYSPVTYIENPFNEPYAYLRLLGQKKKPNYKNPLAFFVEENRTFTHLEMEEDYKWVDGNQKYFVNRKKIDETWLSNINSDKLVNYIFLGKTPVVIFDVGEYLNHQHIRPLIEMANHVYLLTNADLPKLSNFYLGKDENSFFIKKMSELSENKVHWVGNMIDKKLSTNKLFNEICERVVDIPDFPKEHVFKSQEQGITIYDFNKEYQKEVEKIFNPILQQILPKEIYKKRKRLGIF